MSFVNFVFFISTILLVLFCFIRKQLNFFGCICAIIVLLISLLLGGYKAELMLLIFLFSAAVSSRVSDSARGRRNEIHEKEGPRDGIQVLVNTIPALLSLVLFFINRQYTFLIVFSATVSEACADTWASDIGMLSKKKPISVLSFKRIDTGLSGGVSFLGSCISVIIALLWSFLHCLIWGFNGILYSVILFVSSTLGVFFDSFLGALIQVKYFDEQGKMTEKKYAPDGSKRIIAHGLPFINNDCVNLFSGFFSFLLCFLLLKIIGE